ncbi:gp01 [Alphaproteobacteria phage PhiJL001]|uniref:Gp01 n=1 Tax=Alphaproteobacteria phage PhiJL001 TaxID=2681607 RepID=Q5DNA4_9CAUD|nr:gp01 [Alphaproteobacteria phage PhiJL001]AAT69459.1 gp01 [Alphaproteobacteria phage PhiJL001]
MVEITVTGGGSTTVDAESATVNVNGDGDTIVNEVQMVGGIPVYTDLAELPVDGSVLIAIFQPEFGIYNGGDDTIYNGLLFYQGFTTGNFGDSTASFDVWDQAAKTSVSTVISPNGWRAVGLAQS